MKLLGSPKNFPALPSRWDGEPMLWEAWEKRIPTSLDFKLKGAGECEACGLGSSLWCAAGWFARSSMGSRWKRRGMRNFTATRCGWCGHTTVWTWHDEQSWILDETDYGVAGSYDEASANTLF